MKGYFDSIKRFKLKSVFFRFYSLIFTLAILMIVFFSIYIYRVYIQNFSGAQKAAQESFLSQTIEKMDNSVSFLNETVVALSKNIQIVEAVVIPTLDNKEQNFETAQLLMANAENFEYIDRIFLYEDTLKLLYTSNGSVGFLKDSEYTSLIENCMMGQERVFLENRKGRYDTSILFQDGSMYLVCRFISNNQGYFGTLVAELNSDALFYGLKDVVETPQYVLEIKNPYEKVLFFSEKKEEMAGYHSLAASSEYTKWEYLLFVPPYADFTIGAYFKMVFPFLIFLFAAGFFISLLIARRVYSPIHQLLFSIGSEGEEKTAFADEEGNSREAVSEVEVLTMTYKQLQSDQKAAEAFMEQARPELEANLILDLITRNEQTERNSMEKQISAMHSTLRMQGRYQSFIVQLPQAETAEGLIRYMAFRQIQQRLKDIFQAEWGWIYFLRPEGDHSVFVVQYRQEFSVAKIKQVHQVMVSELKQNLDAVCADVLFVHGRVYQDLFNISMSYHEAKEELRKLCYYEAEGDGEANTAQRISVHDGYFTSQLQQLQVYLKNGEVVLGENLLTQLLKELCVSEGGIDPIRSWHMRILDILVEKALDFRTEGDKLGNLEYQMLYRQLELCTDQKTMYLFMVKETSKLLETLKKEINKKQHRLISRAKEYMQQHYSDSSLSIHQIAESVGISDTYLSSIFTEFTGENLVSYLNSYRVTIAKDLLINTRIIIKDIGFKTGFNTVQNFNRVFKRFTGMTPGDYRKQNKADDGENP